VVEWKCVVLVAGEQCVMKNGTDTMPTQHVDSWDSKQTVPFLQRVGALAMLALIGQFIYHKLSVEEMMMY
jgi:uncharacterized membrane protein YjdF